MNCCTKCFIDEQIRNMVDANNTLGDCDFCGQKCVPIYPLDAQTDLSDLIAEVISIYEEAEIGEPLYKVLINDWNIFDDSLPSAVDLVEAFCSTIYGECGFGHDKIVRIPKDYVEQYGVFSGHTWDEFSEVIKTKNRFHNSFFQPEQFVSFLSYSVTKYKRGQVFFRARIWDNGHGFDKRDMGAPPAGKRKPGRINPEGISVLYLTSDSETALSEVRANVFDFVSVGSFRLLKDIKIVNIPGLNSISPVLYSSGLESLAANIKVLSDIAKEIAKPLRRNDSTLEYLPTQYITEFIKSQGYAGVAFESTMGTGGNNIAVFDESLFECLSVRNVEISKLKYSHKELPNP